jgi:hypothetical protein
MPTRQHLHVEISQALLAANFDLAHLSGRNSSCSQDLACISRPVGHRPGVAHHRSHVHQMIPMGMGDQDEITPAQLFGCEAVIGGYPPSGEQGAERRARKKGVDDQDLPASFDLNSGNSQPAEGKRAACQMIG